MDNEKRKKPFIGKIIGIIVALSALSPEVLSILIPIAVIAAAVYIGYKATKSVKGSDTKKPADTFDECPKPICFHRDKGEHHVRKGKEIDPWDRPDIDISKYQRR